jgi:hypothetical protein
MTGKRRALLVGINDYPGASCDLPSCLADVDAMSKLLQDHYDFAVTTLRDGDATLAAVSSALEVLCADVQPDDRICFFYSGHGTTTSRRDSIEECLFLADGGLLPADDFVATMAKVPHGTAVVVLDACFSGGMQKEKGTDLLVPAMRKALAAALTYRPFGRAPKRPGSKQRTKDEAGDETLNAVLLAACQERETAMASTPQTMGLSAFTYALLGTLAQHTSPLAIDDLMTRATDELRRIGVQQTPFLGLPTAPPGLGQEDFPLLQYAANTSVVSSSLADLAAVSARAAIAALQPSH